MVEQVKLSITCQDDTVTIMSFVVNDYNGIEREPTDENINNEIVRSKIPMKSWRRIQDSDIINDRTFRNAWKDDGTKIHVDMPRAREIHKEHLRNVRYNLLDALDVEYMKADEDNDNTKKNEIKQKKQKLRDITNHPAIESTQTPDELKNFWFDSI